MTDRVKTQAYGSNAPICHAQNKNVQKDAERDKGMAKTI